MIYKLVLAAIMTLGMMTTVGTVIPAYGSEQTQIPNQENYYGSFIIELLRHQIYYAIKREYNIHDKQPIVFESSTRWVKIQRGTKADFIVEIKIRPHNVTHYDKVTFNIYTSALERHGGQQGIKLLKYEKNVETYPTATHL